MVRGESRDLRKRHQGADGQLGRGCRRATGTRKDSDQGGPQVLAVSHPSRRALLPEQGSLQDPCRRRADPVGGQERSRPPLFPPLARGVFLRRWFLPARSRQARAAARRGRARPEGIQGDDADAQESRAQAIREDSLRRAPRGFEAIDDPEIAAAIRLKSMVCLRPVGETAIASPALVDDFCAFARDALPLLKWGWDAIANVRSGPPD